MLQKLKKSIQQLVGRQPQLVVGIYAGLTAFATYSCMYAFRKPFTAAGFSSTNGGWVEYKVWLVIAQAIGYMLSKFYGIKFIAELKGANRARNTLLLILMAWVALLFFAVVPVWAKPFCLLINGFPLGLVWGIVFSYVEGRRMTEMMGAVLASSFIFASGFVKTVGKWLMTDWQVSEFWMPFFTGGIFLLPITFFVFLLNAMPLPNAADIAQRTVRLPMNGSERKAFIKRFGGGLLMAVVAYVLITIIRDVRDNFMNEIFTEVGMGNKASVFAKTETPVSFIVLLSTSLLILIKQNFRAFMLNHFVVIAGFAIAFVSTLLFKQQTIGALAWMTLTGTGLYLSYVPFNCIFYERMIASYKVAANVGFLMYISDSFGYMGSVLVMLLKAFGGWQLSWAVFFSQIVLITSGIGIVLMLGALLYFKKKHQELV